MSDSPGPSDDGPGTPTANGDADMGGQAMSANGASAEGSTIFISCLGIPAGWALRFCRCVEYGVGGAPGRQAGFWVE